jgi:hypothetical protein
MFARPATQTPNGKETMIVDLNCPIDALLPLIHEELRENAALYRDGPSRVTVHLEGGGQTKLIFILKSTI